MCTNKIPRLQRLHALFIVAGCLAPDPWELVRGGPPIPRAIANKDAKLLAQAAQPQPSPEPSASPRSDESAPTPTPAERVPSAEPSDPMRNTGNSYWLDNYPLNDLYQYLATQAGLQYFHSTFLEPIKVTGQLFKGGDPVENMRELALQYNLVLYQKGAPIY